MKYLSDVFIAAGVIALSYGAWLMSPPAGFAIAGIASIAYGVAIAAGARR